MCCTSDLVSLPAREEERTWLSVLVFMRVPCVGTVEGSALSVAVHVSGHVSALCVVCLSDTYSVLLLVDRANRKAAAATLSLG